ncbi:MAG: methyltransferase domain-containing protein [bacterium]
MADRKMTRKPGPPGGPPPPERHLQPVQREDETIERLLLDKGLILQKRLGYRFSIDALLLAYLVTRSPARPRGRGEIRYMDLGCGCGIIPILLAKWECRLHGYGVEIQESVADLAQRNMQLHGLEERIRILCADLKRLPERHTGRCFDWITCNPPYRQLRSGRVNPDPQKAMARHEVTASLADVCGVMARLLRPRGRAFLIYPASRSVELLSRMRHAGLEPRYLRPVYPRPGQSARWVLVRAVAGGKEDLLVDEPLLLEDAHGTRTPEVEAIFRWDWPEVGGRGELV